MGCNTTRIFFLSPLYANWYFFTNSEDPDEMPHNAIFHYGLHFSVKMQHFIKLNTIFQVKKDLQQKLENYNLTPLLCTKDYPLLIVSNKKEESIIVQWAKYSAEILMRQF